MRVPITLPLEDPFIDNSAPIPLPGDSSFTQSIVEQVMAADFPDVAALGLAHYAERLTQIVYPNGTQAFFLDCSADFPGYTVAFLEPWTSLVDADGHLAISIKHCTGSAATRRAEEVRRAARVAKLGGGK